MFTLNYINKKVFKKFYRMKLILFIKIYNYKKEICYFVKIINKFESYLIIE